ncbi:RING/U-box protein with C6HC-type zinc finger [Striga asiatica]|uniref:RING/U-box protein with C6HC-type zinc finger n=1 Tax=Striga asiatica TaxID=4170 RepID=A0A5A7PKU1_STRAF|nr:RING/U-box protein with C6HC-type zinc finger [Striga asiatica]
MQGPLRIGEQRPKFPSIALESRVGKMLPGGSRPTSLLWERFAITRFWSWPSSRGISPVSWFTSSFRILRFVNEDMDSGMGPLRLLWDKLLHVNNNKRRKGFLALEMRNTTA